MTIETETILVKLLEKSEEKLDRFIETTQRDLTWLKVGQATLGGKIETLQVKQKNLISGQEAINNKLNKETTWLLTLLTTWLLGLFTALIVGLLAK